MTIPPRLDDLPDLMKQTGAWLTGHFLLTSGLHSGNYIQCALLLRFPDLAGWAGAELANLARPLEPQVVVSPALGGLIIGHEVAKALGAPFLFCEREEGRMVLRRFPHPGPVRVLVVEDVVTTGGSTLEVGQHLAAGGAEWVGSAAIVDRSGGRSRLDHHLLSLLSLNFPVFQPADCPLCRQGLPLVKPGSRTKPAGKTG
jgi:orotate phosphoribosyltransferase